MLTIRAMTDGKGYAQRHLEHSDYYDQRRTVQGEWQGRGADLLGLHGAVTPEQFEAIREVCIPIRASFSVLATALTAREQMAKSRARLAPCTT